MREIIETQTLIFSVDLNNLNPSLIRSPINLRFAADELIVKSISYADPTNTDTPDVVIIWCNITNDNIIGSFTNTSSITVRHGEHFRISNTFQTGILELQFQQTRAPTIPFYYNPQPLISAIGTTHGVVSIEIEFVKHDK